MARDFAAQGWRVAGCARSAEACRELREELGQLHDFQAVDVADDAAVAEWAGRILARFGSPDLLINNAATIAPNAPLWEVARADFDRVIDVNVKGTVNVIR
ncbi:MAG TPA: SDR family oxidoreductase, partial [Chthoniobacterales bacterium]